MTTSAGGHPLEPIVTDPATAGFFAAAAVGELAVLTCGVCESRVHLPRPRCRGCGSRDLEWKPVSQRGIVHSWTVVEHSVHRNYPAPYTVVLVDVDGEESIRMVGFIPGRANVAMGTAVRAKFDDLGVDQHGNPVVLPGWTVDE